MRIAGLQKLTLLDYPEHMAATLFCPGCDFRCPFCHNASLVVPGREGFPVMDLDDIRAFLRKRRGVLDGVCITGGEPLLQPDIAEFCAEIKDMGFAIKLDTNGSFPATLEYLVERGLVDYVAMDVKAAFRGSRSNGEACGSVGRVEVGELGGGLGFISDLVSVFDSDSDARSVLDVASGSDADSVSGAVSASDFETRRFADAIGVGRAHAPALMKAVGESVDFLMREPVPYEFRTTVVRELHDAEHLRAIASDIRGARAWYLQGFVDSADVIGGQGRFHAYEKHEMHALADAVHALVPAVRVRGVD